MKDQECTTADCAETAASVVMLGDCNCQSVDPCDCCDEDDEDPCESYSSGCAGHPYCAECSDLLASDPENLVGCIWCSRHSSFVMHSFSKVCRNNPENPGRVIAAHFEAQGDYVGIVWTAIANECLIALEDAGYTIVKDEA